jgi:hypothetical protein
LITVAVLFISTVVGDLSRPPFWPVFSVALSGSAFQLDGDCIPDFNLVYPENLKALFSSSSAGCC